MLGIRVETSNMVLVRVLFGGTAGVVMAILVAVLPSGAENDWAGVDEYLPFAGDAEIEITTIFQCWARHEMRAACCRACYWTRGDGSPEICRRAAATALLDQLANRHLQDPPPRGVRLTGPHVVGYGG